jgi:hypothetical protein
VSYSKMSSVQIRFFSMRMAIGSLQLAMMHYWAQVVDLNLHLS